jgi:hypothetical protein
MASKPQLTPENLPEILLDVLGLNNVMVSPEGLSDLRRDFRNLGYWGPVTFLTVVTMENLRKAAQVLIDSEKAEMDKKGCLRILWNWDEEISARDMLLGIIDKCPDYVQSDDKTQSDLDLAITIDKIFDRMVQDCDAEIEKLRAQVDALNDMLDEEFWYDNHH